MHDRAAVPPERTKLPEPHPPRTGATREVQRKVSTDKNAPQLIRLVRHPYALDRGTPSRSRYRDSIHVSRDRQPYRVEVEAALAIDRTPPFPKPTDVHPRLEPRGRADATGFLAARDAGLLSTRGHGLQGARGGHR